MTRKAEPARIDARGLKCPWPVLRAARAMRQHEAVLLLANDPVALIDVLALAESNGWTVETRRGPHHDEYHLSRTAAQTAEDIIG